MHEIFHVLMHAGNCHGEITVWVPMIIGFIDGLPFIGPWMATYLPVRASGE